MMCVAVPASAAVLDNRCYYISCKRGRRSCSTKKPLSKLSFNFKRTLLGVLLGKLSTSHSISSSPPSPKRISTNHITNCFAAEAHDIPYSSFGYACENVQNYYTGLKHLKGDALKHKLSSVIARHHSLSYKEVWEALKILDSADFDKPEASSEVIEIYSLRVVSKLLAGKPEGWNREHLWPRSYGLTNGPSLTDLHNIRPADVNVNSSRGNKFYGECHVNTSNCRRPATRESASDTETDRERWAPPVQVRGDIARAIMYMAVCYGLNESGGLNLHLSDSPSIVNREMGMLSTLLKWNEIDPPSREEKLRNERICIKYQHNRNPFVDHPEYANLIWKQVVRRH